jgi:hypothetical protein
MPLQSWNQLVQEAGDISGDFEVLPAADYDLEVVKAEPKQARSGKLMYSCMYKVISGPSKGRTLFDQLVLTTDNPNALRMFFVKMAAIGIDKGFFAQNPSDQQVAEQLVGKQFRAQVGIRKYNGEDKNEVKSYSRLNRTPTSGPQGMPAPIVASPSPLSSPPVKSSPAPSPAPVSAPPAAAATPAQTAAPAAPAAEPIKQADVPPINEPVKTPDAQPVSVAPAAPDDPF